MQKQKKEILWNLFKANNKNPERRHQWRCSGVFFVNVEQYLHCSGVSIVGSEQINADKESS